MTEQLLIIAGSLLAVLALAALVRWMGLGQVKLASEQEAQLLAEDMLSGFKAREIFMSSDGASAALIGHDGSIGLLKQHGAHFAARKIPKPVMVAPDNGKICIDSGEASYGSITLKLTEKDADKLLTMM